MSVKTKILSISALALVILLVILFYRGCSRNQSPTESVTKDEVIDIDTVGLEETPESIDVEQVFSEEPTVEVRKDGSKKKYPQGEWFIKNDVTKAKDIAIEDIADDIVVKPILTDEPIGGVKGVSGNCNDFIIAGDDGKTFYHIKDGRLVGKLHAVGNGPGEYPTQLVGFSYYPADSLFYGYELNIGQIMCYKTSPFKFVSEFHLKPFAENKRLEDILVLGRDHLLLVWRQRIKGYTYSDSCSIHEFDGHSMKKMFDIKKIYDPRNYTLMCSGNDVLMSILEEHSMLYRYVGGKKQKVATIDYGDMEMGRDKVDEKIKGRDVEAFFKLCATGCHYVHLTDSVMTYWVNTHEYYYHYLAIATRDKVQNYKIHIGGLNFDVHSDMVDNGVYTMLIEGDWEEKINPDEKLSPVGKRIIEAMKGNDYDPVILQFRLKNKYLMNN